MPYESILIMVEGKDDINLSNTNFISDPKENVLGFLNVEFKKINFSDKKSLYIGERNIADIDNVRDFIQNGRALEILLMYEERRCYIVDLSLTDVSELKKVIQYDLFEDSSQKENIEKAIAAANKLKNTKER